MRGSVGFASFFMRERCRYTLYRATPYEVTLYG